MVQLSPGRTDQTEGIWAMFIWGFLPLHLRLSHLLYSLSSKLLSLLHYFPPWMWTRQDFDCTIWEKTTMSIDTEQCWSTALCLWILNHVFFPPQGLAWHISWVTWKVRGTSGLSHILPLTLQPAFREMEGETQMCLEHRAALLLTLKICSLNSPHQAVGGHQWCFAFRVYVRSLVKERYFQWVIKHI